MTQGSRGAETWSPATLTRTSSFCDPLISKDLEKEYTKDAGASSQVTHTIIWHFQKALMEKLRTWESQFPQVRQWFYKKRIVHGAFGKQHMFMEASTLLKSGSGGSSSSSSSACYFHRNEADPFGPILPNFQVKSS